MYPKLIKPNTLVIQEGDIGSHLYVSAEGEFDIYRGTNFQHSFGPGVAFGELALLYNTKRLRSISGTLYMIQQQKCTSTISRFIN
ncbi:hypothetical protein TSAR_015407 [Trichomalopsis sarcophagae]|uniref:Cyclic nucleotide-binding domain-containing protein n=1 Tax=Trichomalopsis sarcophagae TaxID=543379 RepID=A0A232FD06_9HYME|nr:hypothetical protein TSAR_015407 [Trichomalopsis sarcophagae]